MGISFLGVSNSFQHVSHYLYVGDKSTAVCFCVLFYFLASNRIYLVAVVTMDEGDDNDNHDKILQLPSLTSIPLDFLYPFNAD